MKLFINGIEKNFDEEMSIQQILERLNIADKVMACAVNMNVVKKDEWSRYKPKENDKIEFLQFVGGG